VSLASLLNFSKGKKLPLKPGLLAVHLAQHGIAFAYNPQASEPPALAFCDYVTIGDPANIPSLLAGFVEKHGLAGVQTSLILDTADYRLTYLDAPNLTDEELGPASKWLVKEFIDFPIDQAVVDGFKLPGKPGQPVKMYAVVTKLQRINQLVALFQAAQLPLVCIDIPELALRNVMNLMAEGSNEIGLLYLQPDFHSLLVSHGGELCLSRPIEAPVAFENTDQNDDAESLERVVAEIERSLTYYMNQMGLGTLSKLLVSARLKSEASIVQQLSEAITVPVALLDITQYIQVNVPLTPAQQILCLVALGGSLRQEMPDATN
jgi:MSHA biogenesis protein MshI